MITGVIALIVLAIFFFFLLLLVLVTESCSNCFIKMNNNENYHDIPAPLPESSRQAYSPDRPKTFEDLKEYMRR